MHKFLFVTYLLISFGALIGVTCDFKIIEVVFKPVIVPIIFVYYLYKTNFKLRGTFTSILILSFASDMTTVFEIEKKQIFILILNFVINLLFLKSFLKDYYKLNNIDFRQIMNGFFIMISLMILVVVCLTMMPNLSMSEMVYYLFYGLVLSLMATVAISNNMLNDNLKIFYALLVSISFIITDVFYVLYNFYLPMKVFLLVNQIVQYASYFFIVNYFITSLKHESVKFK